MFLGEFTVRVRGTFIAVSPKEAPRQSRSCSAPPSILAYAGRVQGEQCQDIEPWLKRAEQLFCSFSKVEATSDQGALVAEDSIPPKLCLQTISDDDTSALVGTFAPMGSPACGPSSDCEQTKSFDTAIRPRNRDKRSAKKKKSYLSRSEAKLTLMLLNIPSRMSAKDVTDAIDAEGFGDTYDLVHMPAYRRRNSSKNLGYVFVDFKGPEEMKSFEHFFQGFRFPNCASDKLVQIRPAYLQGPAPVLKDAVYSSLDSQ